MTIKKSSKVIPMRETIHCPVCGVDLAYTGTSLSSNPPQYLHVCPAEGCEYREFTRETYPRIVYMNEEKPTDEPT